MENWNIFVGVALTVTGTVLVAPSALVDIGRRIKADVIRGAASVSRHFRPKRPTGHASGGTAFADTAAGSDRVSVVRMTSSSSLEERLGGLEGALADVRRQMEDVNEKVDSNRIELTTKLQGAQDEGLRRHHGIERRLQRDEARSKEVNAAGVPVLGLGALIGGAAGPIADLLPVWANTVALVVVVLFCAYAVIPLLRSRAT